MVPICWTLSGVAYASLVYHCTACAGMPAAAPAKIMAAARTIALKGKAGFTVNSSGLKRDCQFHRRVFYEL